MLTIRNFNSATIKPGSRVEPNGTKKHETYTTRQPPKMG